MFIINPSTNAGTTAHSKTLITVVELTTLDAFALVLFVYIVYLSRTYRISVQTSSPPTQSSQALPKFVMSPPRDGLNPPKDDLFTTEQLKNYGGSNPEQSIHVSIKGRILARLVSAVQFLIAWH